MRSTLALAYGAALLVGLSGCEGGYEVGTGGSGEAGAGGAGAAGSPRPAAPARRSAHQMQQSAANLGQIARAMQAHHNKHYAFPAVALRAEDGTPLLSWRVALLPFLGQQGLYGQFHLHEPWDSPHNRALVERMPEVYRSAATEPGTTSFMVFVGEGTPFGGDEAPRLRDIKDGTHNTILCVEAGADRGVPWTKPADVPFERDNPVAPLGQIAGDRFVVVFISGETQQLRKDLEPEKLGALITHWGGEPIFPYQLH